MKTLTAGQTTAIAADGALVSRFLSIAWAAGTEYYSERTQGTVIDPDSGETFLPVVYEFPNTTRQVNIDILDNGPEQRDAFALLIDPNAATSVYDRIEAENPIGLVVKTYQVFYTGSALSSADWITLGEYYITEAYPEHIDGGPNVVRFQVEDVFTRAASRSFGRYITGELFPYAPSYSLGEAFPRFFGAVDSVPLPLVRGGAETTLDALLTDTEVVVYVDSTSAFPASGTIQIDYERITYTGTTADSFTGCTRGDNASEHANGSVVREIPSAGYQFAVADQTGATVSSVKVNGVAVDASDYSLSAPFIENRRGTILTLADLPAIPQAVAAGAISISGSTQTFLELHKLPEFFVWATGNSGCSYPALAVDSDQTATFASLDPSGEYLRAVLSSTLGTRTGTIKSARAYVKYSYSGTNLGMPDTPPTLNVLANGTGIANAGADGVNIATPSDSELDVTGGTGSLFESGTTVAVDITGESSGSQGEMGYVFNAAQSDYFVPGIRAVVPVQTFQFQFRPFSSLYGLTDGEGFAWPQSSHYVVSGFGGYTDWTVFGTPAPADRKDRLTLRPANTSGLSGSTEVASITASVTFESVYNEPVDNIQVEVYPVSGGGQSTSSSLDGNESKTISATASCSAGTTVGTITSNWRVRITVSTTWSNGDVIVDQNKRGYAKITACSLSIQSTGGSFTTTGKGSVDDPAEIKTNGSDKVIGVRTGQAEACVPFSTYARSVGWEMFDTSSAFEVRVDYAAQNSGNRARLHVHDVRVEVEEETTLSGEGGVTGGGLVHVQEDDATLTASVTGTVGATGASITGEEAIQHIWTSSDYLGLSSDYLDTASLSSAITTATSDCAVTWRLDRRIVPGMLRDLFFGAVRESGVRATFEEGKIKFFATISPDTSQQTVSSDVILGSVSLRHVPLSLVCNALTVLYNRNWGNGGAFANSKSLSDAVSQALAWGKLERNIELEWIRNATVAECLGAIWLDDFAGERKTAQVTTYGPRTARLEVGVDSLTVDHPEFGLDSAFGRLVAATWPTAATQRLTVALTTGAGGYVTSQRIWTSDDGTAWIDGLSSPEMLSFYINGVRVAVADLNDSGGVRFRVRGPLLQYPYSITTGFDSGIVVDNQTPGYNVGELITGGTEYIALVGIETPLSKEIAGPDVIDVTDREALRIDADGTLRVHGVETYGGSVSDTILADEAQQIDGSGDVLTLAGDTNPLGSRVADAYRYHMGMALSANGSDTVTPLLQVDNPNASTEDPNGLSYYGVLHVGELITNDATI